MPKGWGSNNLDASQPWDWGWQWVQLVLEGPRGLVLLRWGCMVLLRGVERMMLRTNLTMACVWNKYNNDRPRNEEFYTLNTINPSLFSFLNKEWKMQLWLLQYRIFNRWVTIGIVIILVTTRSPPPPPPPHHHKQIKNHHTRFKHAGTLWKWKCPSLCQWPSILFCNIWSCH